MERPRHREQINWTADMLARLRSGWAAGKTASEIGDDIGISRSAVLGKSRRLNLEVRRAPSVFRPDGLQFADHLADGMSVAEAGAAIGLSGSIAEKLFAAICRSLGPQAR
jgi:hypothetical protein